jgi:hypothetical protein
MNRNRLILLQAVGALSILPYPFVLLANIMSIAAPGHNSINSLPWIALSFYPLVWIGLYVFSWRAMRRGSVRLAFGLSSIPAFFVLLAVGIFAFSWIGFGLGMVGIGSGGLHSETYPINNSLGRGSLLNAALDNLFISLDGRINGDTQPVRALVARGEHLNGDEATDLRKTWMLRRVLHDGPVNTASENPLVWRIVTHNRGDSKPFNPLTDKLPERLDGTAPFLLKDDEIPLLNRPTMVHGTPLYAALLDHAQDVCTVIIKAGGRLSAEEERDPAAAAALRGIFERDPDLRVVYNKAP